jgi:Brp/Blh family beta-carotene 15,15'-monooxygenase
LASAFSPSDRDWFPTVSRRYTHATASITAVAGAGLLAFGSPSPFASAVVMALCVAFVGLPHGAFDMHVAQSLLAHRIGRTWRVTFVAFYAALAIVAMFLWMAAPLLGLTCLLVIGAAHWGDDDLHDRTGNGVVDLALATSRGAIPVALPLLFHPEAAASIFSALLGGAPVSPGLVLSIGWTASLAATPGVLIGVALSANRSRRALFDAALELTTLAFWFAVAEPILAFTCYFCFWHAVRHSLKSMSRLDRRRFAKAARAYAAAVAWPTLATCVLAIPFLWMTLASTDAPDALARVVFIGLFALTIPHTLLEWLADRVSSDAPA